MSFISLYFIAFIFLLFIVYYLFPKLQKWTLLIGSILFYISYGFEKIPFILLAGLSTYVFAYVMDKVYVSQDCYIAEHNLQGNDKKEYILGNKRKTKVLLITAITILLILLVYAKAGKWIFGQNGAIPVIVALGVSYYTFSMIGYLADVYWRKEKAEKNYFKFLLFAIYFPKILQGPISRHKFLAPQFEKTHSFVYEEFCYGLQLMLWGYFKKMVIADRLAVFVNKVYNEYDMQSGSILIVATIFGALQLYCDFSGCMDIALGISECLGLKLESNFNHPFFSRSAAEFWRRWHITLGTWFKDYVYMPISASPRLIKAAKPIKNKFGIKAARNFMTVIPLLVVWIFTGLWHGTGLTYIVWGIYWGILIIFGMLFEPSIKKLIKRLKINTETYSFGLLQCIGTFLLFCVSRIITIPGNLKASFVIFKRILTDFHIWKLVDGSIYNCGLSPANFNLSIVLIVLLWHISMFQEKGVRIRETIAKQNLVIRWGIYCLALFAVIVFGIYGSEYDASSFVYMNY